MASCLDVENICSGERDINTSNVCPKQWSIGESAFCKSLLCTIVDIHTSVLGTKLYSVKYAVNGDQEVVPKHLLYVIDMDDDDDFLPTINTSDISCADSFQSVKKATKRHLDLENDEIDEIAKCRLSHNTSNQTRWAVKLFRGKQKYFFLTALLVS